MHRIYHGTEHIVHRIYHGTEHTVHRIYHGTEHTVHRECHGNHGTNETCRVCRHRSRSGAPPPPMYHCYAMLCYAPLLLRLCAKANQSSPSDEYSLSRDLRFSFDKCRSRVSGAIMRSTSWLQLGAGFSIIWTPYDRMGFEVS